MDFNSTQQKEVVFEELAAFFKTHQATTYLLAVSGGKDSMLLCELMRLLCLPFELVHVNYGLRNEQSDLDQAFIEAYSQKHQLVLHLKKMNLDAQLRAKNANLQAKAREIRYTFFKEIQEKTPNSLICTAHHADDQLETFWLQLARGAGLKGLAGMQFAGQGLLRPLLNYDRQTLRALSETLAINWREDLSNQTLKYRRNLWRLELLPFLRCQIPAIDQSVAVLQKQFAFEIEAQEIELKEAQLLFKKNSSIELNKIIQLTSYQIVELFKNLDVPTYIIRRISDLFYAENGKYLTWKDRKSGKSFFVVRQKEKIALYKEEQSRWCFKLVTPISFKQNQTTDLSHLIDFQKIVGDLYFRKVQAGDTIKVSGLQGSKKVLQIFKEMGIPAPLRSSQYVLCDQQKVIAIPPTHINTLVNPTESSSKVLQLLFSKKP
jgi:tRNA(Ile)-lysidine synthase